VCAAVLALLSPLACQSLPEAPEAAPALDPDLVQRGAFLFLDPRISGDGQRACATCHPGGGTNGRVYRQGLEVDPGTPGGRDVPMLRGAWQTAPYLRDGSLPTLREAVVRMLEVEMRGASLGERDLDALVAYVESLPPFDRGRIEPDGTPIEPTTLAARRGFGVWKRAGCERCHPTPAFMRPIQVDIGTGGPFDVPSLRGLSSSPPYGHDGRWGSVEQAVDAVLALHDVELAPDDRERLIAYLKLL